MKRRDKKLMAIAWAIGKKHKCQNVCKCRREVDGSMEHVWQKFGTILVLIEKKDLMVRCASRD